MELSIKALPTTTLDEPTNTTARKLSGGSFLDFGLVFQAAKTARDWRRDSGAGTGAGDCEGEGGAAFSRIKRSGQVSR